jgi:hypothetical protein
VQWEHLKLHVIQGFGYDRHKRLENSQCQKINAAGRVAQVIECLLSKPKPLISNLGHTHTKLGKFTKFFGGVGYFKGH